MMDRAPVHQHKCHTCTCQNCGSLFKAASKAAIWCETILCQAAKVRYYKQRLKKKPR